MHSINMNERLVISPAQTPPIRKQNYKGKPNRIAGFPQEHPKISHSSSNLAENIQEKPVNKQEILSLIQENPLNSSSHREIPIKNTNYEGIIGNLEENVKKIREKRQHLFEKIHRFTDDGGETPIKSRNYEEKPEETEKDVDWAQRLFSTKPSLQNVENIIENQRKNLTEIANLYKLKKNSSIFSVSHQEKLQKPKKNESFPAQPLKKAEILEDEGGFYKEAKQKHKELDEKFLANATKSPSLFPIKLKTETKPNVFVEESPKFGKNHTKNTENHETRFEDYQKQKALKQNNDVFLQSLEKKPFDNWRNSENHEKTLRFSEETIRKPFIIKASPAKFRDLPTKPKKNANNADKDPLLSHIFEEIDKDSLKIASKQEVFNYLMGNEKVLTAFELKKEGLYQALEQFPSERPGLVKEKEFIAFVKRFPELNERKLKGNAEKPTKKPVLVENAGTLLEINEELLDILREVFVEMDKYEDFIVKRAEFLKKLRQDPRVLPHFPSVVTTISLVNRSFRLEEVLETIEKDAFPEDIPSKIAKEWLSWAEFHGFFTNLEKLLGGKRGISEETLRISPENLMIMRDLFDSQPRVAEFFVQTADFVMEAKKDPLIKPLLGNLATEARTLGDFLDNLLENAPDFIEWKDVLDFLQEKHVDEPRNQQPPQEEEPKDQENLEDSAENHDINQENREIYKGNYIESFEEMPDNLDQVAYLKATRPQIPRDFAEKYYQLQALDALNQGNHQQPPENLANSSKMRSNSSISRRKPATTVPKGPSFLEKAKISSIRQRKVEEMVKAVQDEEKNAIEFRFKAKDVPSSVKLPKYDNIKLSEAEKKLKRREKVTETKPFAFDSREQAKVEEKKLSLEESQRNEKKAAISFKAREIPQSCRNLMFEELEKKAEEERKARVEARIEENKQNVKGFERMQEAETKRKEKEQEFKKKNAVDPKNFKPDLENSKKSIEKLRKEGIIAKRDTAAGVSTAKLLEEDDLRSKALSKASKLSRKSLPNNNICENNQEIDESEEINGKNREENEREASIHGEIQQSFKEISQENAENEANFKEKEQEFHENQEKTVSAKGEKDNKNQKSLGKMTKKQLDMQKLKEKEQLERQKKAEELKKQEEEKKAKEKAMKQKVQEKYKVPEASVKKDTVKKRDNTFEKQYEEEKRKREERMANRPLMVDSGFHTSKALARYRKLIDNYKEEENNIQEDKDNYQENIEDKQENIIENYEKNDDDDGDYEKNNDDLRENYERNNNNNSEENNNENNDEWNNNKNNDNEENNDEEIKQDEEENNERIVKNSQESNNNTNNNNINNKVSTFESRESDYLDTDPKIPGISKQKLIKTQEIEENAEDEAQMQEDFKENIQKNNEDNEDQHEDVQNDHENDEENRDNFNYNDNNAGENQINDDNYNNNGNENEENDNKNDEHFPDNEENLDNNEKNEENNQEEQNNNEEQNNQEEENNEKRNEDEENPENNQEERKNDQDQENFNNEDENNEKNEEGDGNINIGKDNYDDNEEEINNNKPLSNNNNEEENNDNIASNQNDNENPETINNKENDQTPKNDIQGIKSPEIDEEINEDLAYENEGFESEEASPAKVLSPKINEKSKSSQENPKVTSKYLENIDPSSKLYSVLSKCISTNQPFADPEFPAALPSLCKDPAHKNYRDTFQKVQWLRPQAIFKTSDFLLFDKIDPNDISQGSLGDCYFLATCSAIAEFPARIQKIFLNKTANPFGAYSVKIFIQGVPQEILIDDQIPCLNGQPLFTKPVGNELWVMLLEKAWAKVFNSYATTEGGLPDMAMEHLLGCPAKGYSPQNDKDLFANGEKLRKLLRESDQRNHVICAGSKGQGEVKNKGIVSGHAYTIIGVYEKNNDFILKMRNPWGSFEWEGKYKEDSSVWSKALIQELGMVKADDGVFFMTIEEFLNEFNYLGICFYEDKIDEFSFFNVKTRAAGYFILENRQENTADFQITVHQTLKDLAQAQGFQNYNYSPVDLELLEMNQTSKKFENCLANGDSQRFFGDSSVLINDQGVVRLKKGKYLIRAKVYWNNEVFTNKSNFKGFNLTVVGAKGSYSLMQAENTDGRRFMREFFEAFARNSQEKNKFEPKNAWFAVSIFPEGENEIPRACIIIASNEEKSEKMELSVTLKELSNLRLKKEILGSEKSFVLNVGPGKQEIVICKTIEKNKGLGFGGMGARPKFMR